MGWASVNSSVEMAVNYLHLGKISMAIQCLNEAKDELDTMEDSKNLRIIEHYQKSTSTN